MKTNDIGSFQRAYEKTYPILIRVSYNVVGDMDIAEDLCQEAFIRFYKREIPFPNLNEAKYWLIRVVKNLSLNYQKRKVREYKALEKVYNEPKRPQESGEGELLKKETNHLVRQALEKLPEKFRMVLVLKEYGQLNYKEIGKILRISEGNVKVRVFRAREQLEKLLKQEEVYVP